MKKEIETLKEELKTTQWEKEYHENKAMAKSLLVDALKDALKKAEEANK